MIHPVLREDRSLHSVTETMHALLLRVAATLLLNSLLGHRTNIQSFLSPPKPRELALLPQHNASMAHIVKIAW